MFFGCDFPRSENYQFNPIQQVHLLNTQPGKKKGKRKRKKEKKKQGIQGKEEQNHTINKFPMSGIMIITDRMNKNMERVITYRRHPGFLKFNLHRWRKISRE